MNDLETCPACRCREGIPEFSDNDPATDGYFVCMRCRFRWHWLDDERRMWGAVRASDSTHDGVKLIDMGD